MEVTTDLIYQVLIVVFGLLTVYFAAGLVNAKQIAAKVSVFLKETAETLDLIGKATEDNQITKEELATIFVQAQENLNSAKTLIDEIKALAGFLSSFSKK
jgi:hypothetical protein